MTDCRPPRAAEAILHSLGARSEFRDEIIGDIEEEFAERLERLGPGSARLWFWAETMRTAPHLARSWWATADRAELRLLLADIGFAYIITAVVEMFVSATTVSIATAAGAVWINDAWLLAVWSAAVVVSPILSGYMAASLHDRARVVAAAAMGLVLSLQAAIVFLVNPFVGHVAIPIWLQFLIVVAVALTAAFGGIIRARSGARYDGMVPAP